MFFRGSVFMFELKENKEQRNKNAFLISLGHNFLVYTVSCEI